MDAQEKMEVEIRLEHCEYRLKRMEEAYGKDFRIFVYESQDFLTNARSIMEYIILYDFAKKFKLEINENERLDQKIFEEKARESNNARALEFIKWWESKRKELINSRFGPLFEKRNIAVHRRSVKPERVEVKVYENVSVRESIRVIKKDEKGEVYEIFQSPEEPISKPEPKPPESDWYYKEYPNENIVDVCRKFLETLRGIVEEAKSKFD